VSAAITIGLPSERTWQRGVGGRAKAKGGNRGEKRLRPPPLRSKDGISTEKGPDSKKRDHADGSGKPQESNPPKYCMMRSEGGI